MILDAYNNNTRMHIVKTRITHNSRKQTNKKKRTKRCLARQLDEERGATRYNHYLFVFPLQLQVQGVLVVRFACIVCSLQ